MSKIIKLVLFLSILAGISGGLLTYINNITSPIIIEHASEMEKENLSKLFPDSDFEKLSFNDESGMIKAGYKAGDSGYAFTCETIGYEAGTPINFIVAFDNDGNTVGYTVLSQAETSGLGDRITEEPFISGVVGKKIDEKIDLITGSTISSSAVSKAIEAAKLVFLEVGGQ